MSQVKEAAPKPKVFGTLMAEVIKKGLCCGCGACVASCPVAAIAIKDENPSIVSKCFVCETCYYQCPKADSEAIKRDLEMMVFGRHKKPDEDIGIYTACYAAKSTKEEILKVAQDGGVVTSLLAYALDKGLVECCVVSGLSDKEPWKPVPKVAFSLEELLKCAGTRYTTSPNLIGLMSAVEEYAKEKVAFVGTPCQIDAVRRMQHEPMGCLKLGNAVKYAIGLFCMENFVYNSLINSFIREAKGVDLSKIAKFAITKGKFIVYTTDGREAINVPVGELDQYVKSSCKSCTDFTSELADISVGSVGSPDGWCTVIVRTKAGEELFEGAASEGYIEYKPIEQVKPGLPAVVKVAKMKAEKAKAGHS